MAPLRCETVLNSCMRVALVHPNLVLGGAERLMVDAAVQLRNAGHAVTIFTSHHDPQRSFAPVRDGTLDVQVRAAQLPAAIFNRLRAPCMLLKMSALAASLRRHRGAFDVVFCDLVAHIVPGLHASLRVPVVFYCHFPDLLLRPPSRGIVSLYRAPIDALEARGMARADVVLVNSRFTQSETARVFPKIQTEILYPGIDPRTYCDIQPVADREQIVVACVNRFQREKNASLAIETLARLRTLIPSTLFARVRLIVAGGHDGTFDALATHRDLRALAERLGVASQVEFLLSPSDEQRMDLLERCRILVHTHPGEHFGLAPVEAMAAGRAVIAAGRGGPLETVVHGRTGFLCAPEPQAFARAAAGLLLDFEKARRMGAAARDHIRDHFTLERFGAGLESALRRAIESRQ